MEAGTAEETNIVNEEQNACNKNGEATPDALQSEGHSAVVAAHYNALEEKGLKERNKSRIVYLRNFNNWTKSMLINEYMGTIKDSLSVGTPIRVLDMCCGKGGDLLKWRSAGIRHLVCADIAETSVDQCRNRYEEMQGRQRRERHGAPSFTAEFIVADCTRVRLREKYKDASQQLDLVSCQFSFHYCFESLPQAECMLRNAAECLRAGGYFIGTMPDANAVVARYRASGSTAFGNPVYNVEFEKSEPFPLFGAKYSFTLKDVVNCPEFLVHVPTLERLARRHGLELVSKSTFEEFYEKNKEKGRGLLGKMQALETFPPFEKGTLNGEENEYAHAKEFIEKNKDSKVDRIGTLSQPEWEAASFYMVFAFRKMKAQSMDELGRPVYDVKPKKPTTDNGQEANKKPIEQPNKMTEDEEDNVEELSKKQTKVDDTT